MKKMGLVALLILCLNSHAQEHLKNARALLEGVTPENSRYQHGEQIVTWANSQTYFQSYSDCSGLISAIFNYSYNYENNELQKWLGKKRPVASSYHQAIVDQNRFKLIESPKDARPGDIIAIEYRDGSTNTGHVMILSSVPKIHNPSNPVIPNSIQWELKVIDSALSGHGKEDTRFDNNLDRFRSGIGEGTMRIYTDTALEVIGYSWSMSPKSMFYSQKDRHLVIGRPLL